MYVEMYKGFIQLLDPNPDREDLNNMKKLGKVPHYMNLVFGIEPTDIKRVKILEFKDIPDIIMVLARLPENKDKAQYADYIMYEGKIRRILLFNLNMIEDKEDIKVPLYAIAWSTWKAVFSVVENYTHMYERRAKNPTLYNATSVMYYASAILIIAIIDKLFNNIDAEYLKDLINLFYTPSITVEGVESMRKLISDIGLELLLDYNMWSAVDEKSYPGSHFAESDDDDEEDNNDKPDSV